MIRGSFPGWRDGKPRIISQGVFDGDAVVYELFPMQTVVFNGSTSTEQSIPMPVFDTSEHAAGVLSLMIKDRTGFAFGRTIRVWIQNAVQRPEDPTVIFSEDVVSANIGPSSVPRLETAAFSTVGPMARLRFETDQLTNAVMTATFAVWLTLRRA